MRIRFCLLTLIAAGACLVASVAVVQRPRPVLAAGARVEITRAPEGGYQCQVAVDSQGTIHLVYVKGDPKAGDIYYCRREGTGWSAPLRVNSRAGSAVAMGTIRGPQLAVGKGGKVYVVWFGSAEAGVKGPADSAPLLYTRLNDAGSAFEPQRNLMQSTTSLDGGPGIAADTAGNVYVAWQATDEREKGEGPGKRQLWVARSGDGGQSFSREARAWEQPLGACPCCSTEAFVDGKGTLYVLYRMAANRTERDTVLLVSADHGRTFRGKRVDPWPIDGCPMSSEAFAEGAGTVVGAWETQGQVKYARIVPGTPQLSTPVGAPGPAEGRKHPVVALNGKGELLFAWTEGTGWNRGGALAWQLYDASGRPKEQGRLPGAIPVWGLAAAAVRPDGSFLLVH